MVPSGSENIRPCGIKVGTTPCTVVAHHFDAWHTILQVAHKLCAARRWSTVAINETPVLDVAALPIWLESCLGHVPNESPSTWLWGRQGTDRPSCGLRHMNILDGDV